MGHFLFDALSLAKSKEQCAVQKTKKQKQKQKEEEEERMPQKVYKIIRDIAYNTQNQTDEKISSSTTAKPHKESPHNILSE